MVKCRCSTLVLNVAFWIFLLVQPAAFAASRPVVILDPGHGGVDTGVKGSYGTLEKDVTLAVALEVRHQLGPLYDVRLTRESDRAVSLTGRVERANSVAGELLLSLHVGGGLSREVNRMAVFVQRGDQRSFVGAGGLTEEGWASGHAPYLQESRELATDLKRALMGLQGYDGVGVTRVPLMISRGARMPVALVELGNLVHPRQERRMTEARHIRRLASVLASAIEGFFAR